MNHYKLHKIILFLSFWLINYTFSFTQNDFDKPNIIIIYADDVGYGDIGAYGAKKIPTPAIDQLADEGLLFTNGYCTAATCTPSRYSLLTGEYAFRNDRARVLSGEAPLLIAPGSPTLPSILREAGYTTSVIGKWHLGMGTGAIDWNKKIEPGPLEVGFDESFVIPATNDRVPTVYVDGHYVHQLSEEDKPLRVSYNEKIGDLPTGESHPDMLMYPADPQHSGTIINNISRIGWMEGGESAWWKDEEMPIIFADRSKDFIEENQNNPFFLFLSLHETHVPIIGKSGTGLRGDAIVEIDWIVEQVMNKIQELNLENNTIIIFSSDNGPVYDDGYTDGAIKQANGHKANGILRGGKYLAYEGGTRVPFIVSWQGRIKPGISHALLSQVDLLASISELINAKPSKEAGPDSFNLLPALLGESEKGRDYVVQQCPTGLSIRKGKWKLIPANTKAPEWADEKHNARLNPISTPMWPDSDALYNLDLDPDESVNLADLNPSIVKELTALLEKIREMPDTKVQDLK